jgi:hypothetical protein
MRVLGIQDGKQSGIVIRGFNHQQTVLESLSVDRASMRNCRSLLLFTTHNNVLQKLEGGDLAQTNCERLCPLLAFDS